MVMAGETLNIFLLTGISNINIFFLKKKKNVVVNSKLHLNYAKSLLKTNTIDFHLRG